MALAQRLSEEFERQDRLVIVDDLVPETLLEKLRARAHQLEPRAVRKVLPGYKASGSVSFHQLSALAPEICALYHSRALTQLLSSVAGVELLPCPVSDPHSCALYYYTRPGDRVGFHYDTSHYKGRRFTVLLGLENDTASHLHCRLYTRVDGRTPEDLLVPTDPGRLVFFDGDRLQHSVTPLGDGERRIVLTMQYVTEPHMTATKRFFSNLKDAIAYFGFRQWLKNGWNATSRVGV